VQERRQFTFWCCYSIRKPKTEHFAFSQRLLLSWSRRSIGRVFHQYRNFVNIPTGSEDSALSCSDENGEIDIHVTAAVKKQKYSERLSSKWSQAEKVQKHMTWKRWQMLYDEEKTKFMGNREFGNDLQQQLCTPSSFSTYLQTTFCAILQNRQHFILFSSVHKTISRQQKLT